MDPKGENEELNEELSGDELEGISGGKGFSNSGKSGLSSKGIGKAASSKLSKGLDQPLAGITDLHAKADILEGMDKGMPSARCCGVGEWQLLA